jgi:hypothetical protein
MMNEENDFEQKKNNNSLVVILSLVFIIVILLGFCGYFGYSTISGTRTKGNDVTTTTTTSEVVTTQSLGNLSKEAVSNIEKSLNITFHDTDIVSGKEYLEDADFKFAFFVYLYSWESENLENSDNGTTGLFTMNVDTFNSLYFKSFGEQFDISKLDKNRTFYKGVKYPTISDNKIHSSFYTGPDPLCYKYKYESMCEEDGLYKLTYMYGFMKDNGNGLEIQPYGSSYLKLSVDPKGFISYKSFISTK